MGGSSRILSLSTDKPVNERAAELCSDIILPYWLTVFGIPLFISDDRIFADLPRLWIGLQYALTGKLEMILDSILDKSSVF